MWFLYHAMDISILKFDSTRILWQSLLVEDIARKTFPHLSMFLIYHLHNQYWIKTLKWIKSFSPSCIHLEIFYDLGAINTPAAQSLFQNQLHKFPVLDWLNVERWMLAHDVKGEKCIISQIWTIFLPCRVHIVPCSSCSCHLCCSSISWAIYELLRQINRF